ncbi:aspartate kinase [Thermogladius calderae 1633]|uniref:Aspartate kinase n=1 Tax=Thermogladius calderae (strain DSM 22663 / VKM B-2946 / 1633) TaxID=1184251 RepID=I3TEL7_THEC1|nr:aspartate kinase [Thermogladius calderae]AFK51205.1 aspartate kinase [Thermogladius calderae 1633]
MRALVVVKIGGSNLSNIDSYVRAAGYVRQLYEAGLLPIVVVSAAKGVTDKLLVTLQGDINAFHEVVELYSELARGIGGEKLEQEVRGLAEVPLKAIKAGLERPVLGDIVLSYGEKASKLVLSSAIETEVGRVVRVDAEEVIKTDSRHGDASIIYENTEPRVEWLVKTASENNVVIVIEGFIGSGEKGVTTTLGRGGSDLTATAIAALGGIGEVRLITNVKGVYSVDPELGVKPRVVKCLSYREADEAARHGVKRFNAKTFEPLLFFPGPVVRIGDYEHLGSSVMRELEEGDKGPKIIHASLSPHPRVVVIGEDGSRLRTIRRVVEVLESEDVEIQGLEAGVGRHSVVVYIPKDYIPRAVRLLHKNLIGEAGS